MSCKNAEFKDKIDRNFKGDITFKCDITGDECIFEIPEGLTCDKKTCKTNKEVLQERLKNGEIDALDYLTKGFCPSEFGLPDDCTCGKDNKNDCYRCWNGNSE